jgi:hypothetical protein
MRPKSVISGTAGDGIYGARRLERGLQGLYTVLTGDSRWAPIIPRVRKLALLACSAAVAAVFAGLAGAAAPTPGTLGIEAGKGTVTVEIKGSIIGVAANGSVRVTDLTPRDRFVPYVFGRRLSISRVGPKTILYRGKALRYRMLGGSTRVVVKGSGISLSASGRGHTILDAERRFPDEDAGYYSLEGIDCSLEVALCLPLPDVPERHLIGTQKTTTRSFQPR